MTAMLSAETTLARGDDMAEASDLRASTGIVVGGVLSCGLWAGIVAAVLAVS